MWNAVRPNFQYFVVSSDFREETSTLRFQLGKDAKAYIGKNTDIQTNKISEETLLKATREFLEYLKIELIDFNIDNFSAASHTVFTKQETEYLSGMGYKVFSMLTLAFLQMGIIELD